MITENQIWMQPTFSKINPSGKNLETLVNQVESYFKNITGTIPVLFPSARSAISAIFEIKNLKRNHTIYAPAWSSHCLWETIGRRSNPVSQWVKNIDSALIVHKWGHVTSSPKAELNQIIIEDSVDSLLVSNEALFPNQGSFEIQSLPKLIGSYSGGLVYCKSESDREQLISLRSLGSAELAKRQDELKLKTAQGENQNEDWHPFEWKNFSLIDQQVEQILLALPNYEKSILSSERRSKLLQTIYPIKTTQGRIPTAWPIPPNEETPTWHFDINLSALNPNYIKVGGLPLHAEISDVEFDRVLKKLP